MENISRYIMFAGAAIFLVGAAMYFAAKFNVPIGRLPGDIRIERDGVSFYFPLASSILISIILTLLLNLVSGLWKK